MDYKNFKAQKYEEKLDAFTGCFLILSIMFFLVVIGAVVDDKSQIVEVTEYAAIQLKNCGGDHEKFY